MRASFALQRMRGVSHKRKRLQCQILRIAVCTFLRVAAVTARSNNRTGLWLSRATILAMSLEAILSGAAGRVRTTDESPPRYAIIDVIGIVLGCSPHDAANTWLRLQRAEGLQHFDKTQFAGQGQRTTPICTAKEAREVVDRLGGKHAAEFRVTGKTDRAPKHDDLYIMKYSFDDSAVKIGRSNDVQKRQENLQAGHNFFVEIVTVFPGKGRFETEVHRNLQDYRSKRGTGREWFDIAADDATAMCSATLRDIAQARVPFPKTQCLILSKLAEVTEEDACSTATPRQRVQKNNHVSFGRELLDLEPTALSASSGQHNVTRPKRKRGPVG